MIPRHCALLILLLCITIPPPSFAEFDPMVSARDAFHAGDYEAAIRWYDDLLSSRPADDTALIGRLTALSRLSRWDEVVQGISAYGPDSAGNPEMAVLSAEASAMTGRPDDALALLNGSSTIAPADDLRIRAEALMALEKDSEALALIQNYTAVQGPDPRLSLLTGTILIRQGNVTGALPFLEEAAVSLPHEPAPDKALGNALASLGMYEEALVFIGEAAELNPHDPDIRVIQAYILNRVGRYDDALPAIQQAITLRPSDPDLINAHAYTLFLANRTEEAGMRAEEALHLNPDDPAAMDTLGSILLAKGDTEAALKYLEPAADLLTDDPEVLTHLAEAYLKLGRDTEAQDLYQRAIRIDSGLGRAWRGYSEVLLRLGRYSEAATTIAETFRHYPGDPDLIAWEERADAVLKEWYIKQHTNPP